MISKFLRKLTGYRTRINYWSLGSIAKGIQEVRGFPTPIEAGTSKEFREWDKKAKAISPSIFWLTTEGFDHLQNIWLFIPDVYHNARIFISNTLTQSNCLTTGLPVGGYYDTDTLIRESLFKAIVDFVEIEQAAMWDMAYDWNIAHDNDDESRKTLEQLPDRRDAGIAHLDWEIELGDESPYQSKRAIEIKEIYLWVKDIRPNRMDPHDHEEWRAYCDGKEDIFDTAESEEERKHVRRLLDEVHTLELQQKEEDTAMLIRIIKVREGLWT